MNFDLLPTYINFEFQPQNSTTCPRNEKRGEKKEIGSQKEAMPGAREEHKREVGESEAENYPRQKARRRNRAQQDQRD